MRRTLITFPALIAVVIVISCSKSSSPTGPVKTATTDTLPPSFAIITPTYGFVGDTVRIWGRHFHATRGTAAVAFTSANVQDYVAWTDTILTVRVPTGAATGVITITTQYGSITTPVFTVFPTSVTGTPLITMKSAAGGQRWVSYSADGRYVISAGASGVATIWDAATGSIVQRLIGHTKGLLTAVFSPDGRSALTVSSDQTAKIWDVGTGSLRRTLDYKPNYLWAAEFNGDGTRVLAAGDDGFVTIYDTAGGAVVRSIKDSGSVYGAQYSHDGRVFATASGRGWSKIWSVADGTVQQTFTGHEAQVLTAVFSNDDKSLLTASYDGTAKIWDVATATVVKNFPGGGPLHPLADAMYSPDGRYIVTAGLDSTASVWDASAGTLMRTLIGHNGHVNAAMFSPNGRFIVTAGSDSSVRIWAAP